MSIASLQTSSLRCRTIKVNNIFENVFSSSYVTKFAFDKFKVKFHEIATVDGMEKVSTESQARVVDTGFNIILADFNLDWADQN